MSIPEEIESVRFPITSPGYDEVEVEGFLKRLADDIRILTAELDVARARAERPFLEAGREVGDLLQRSHDIAEKLVRDSEMNAARILQEAETSADETREGADKDARRNRKEAEVILSEARSEAARLKEQADHHLRLGQAEVTVARREAHRDAKELRAQAKKEVERAREQARAELEEVAKRIRRLRATEAELQQQIDLTQPRA